MRPYCDKHLAYCLLCSGDTALRDVNTAIATIVHWCPLASRLLLIRASHSGSWGRPEQGAAAGEQAHCYSIVETWAPLNHSWTQCVANRPMFYDVCVRAWQEERSIRNSTCATMPGHKEDHKRLLTERGKNTNRCFWSSQPTSSQLPSITSWVEAAASWLPVRRWLEIEKAPK